jgi:hypothetical protein
MVLSACGAGTREAPIESLEAALYGPLTIVSSGADACSSTHASAITSIHAAGRRIASTPEFAATLRREMSAVYLPCNGVYENVHVLYDPFWSETAEVRYTRARAIMTGSAAITIGCRDLGNPGQAVPDSYGNPHEQVVLGRGYLDGNLANGLTDEETASVAGILWHEALHQQGYYDCDSDGNGEGYSSSLPQRAVTSMVTAGLAGRILLFGANQTAISLPVGVSTGPDHFGAVGDDGVSQFRLGPALRATFCTNSDGTGTCATVDNAMIYAGNVSGVPVEVENAVSYVRVEPLVLAFSDTDYRGAVERFTYGEYLSGQLGAIGNDNIRSLYVPAGARVRACAAEGAGHGGGDCAIYDTPAPSALAGISYLDVMPVVTAFSNTTFGGGRASLYPGVWSGALGLGPVVGGVSSLIVPPGLTARLCSGGTCQIHTRSSFSTAFVASSIEVQPVSNPQLLTVQRHSLSAGGSVVSVPDGVSCAGFPCFANFHDRGYVRLRGYADAANGLVTWSGCDTVSDNDCLVSMLGARTVTVRFEQVCNIALCVNACVLDGIPRPQCLSACRRNPCLYP